jgi:hypothetical protein
MKEQAPRVVFVERTAEKIAPHPAGRFGTIWSRLSRILAAPAWGLAAASLSLAVLGLAHFRIERPDGGFAFGFGPAPVTTAGAPEAPVASPVSARAEIPALTPVSAPVPTPVSASVPGHVPAPESTPISGSDSGPTPAQTSARPDRTDYVTRNELDAYTRAMGEAMLQMIADYTRQRDQAVTQFVQTALSGVSDRQADNYRELRTQIEDLGSGVLEDRARTEARLDYLYGNGGQSKQERIGAAPGTSEGEKP